MLGSQSFGSVLRKNGPIAEALPLDVVPTVRLVGHASSGTKGLDHVLERVRDGE
jgi:hypothetical protein